MYDQLGGPHPAAVLRGRVRAESGAEGGGPGASNTKLLRAMKPESTPTSTDSWPPICKQIDLAGHYLNFFAPCRLLCVRL